MLRRGNHNNAKSWRRVPLPVIERYRDRDIPKYFRGDAAFANPALGLAALKFCRTGMQNFQLAPMILLVLGTSNDLLRLLPQPIRNSVRFDRHHR